MKAVFVTDTHWDQKHGYQNILDVQTAAWFEMFDYMQTNDIKTIFHLGDVTDNRKHISLNTLYAMQQVFDRMQHLEYTMHCLIGNHDIHHKNTLEINSMSLFAKAYDNLMLYDAPKMIEFDSVKFQMIPWIVDDVEIDDSADIILCHAELKDFMVVRGHKATHGHSADIFKGKTVYSGHYHIAQSQGKIKYLGNSFTQNDWNDYKERKGFWVFDSLDQSMTFVESKSTPKHVKCTVDSDAKTVLIQGLHDVDQTMKLDSKFDYKMFTGHKLKVYATKELAIIKKFIESIETICDSWKLEIMSEEIEIDISERIEKAKEYSIDDKIIEICDESDRDLIVSIIQEAKSTMKEAC